MGAIGALLDLSRRSLNTQSIAIKVTGDNIANVNTPGYSRRRADLVTTQPSGAENLQVGSGVAVERVVRIVDAFLNTALNERISDRAQAEARADILGRAEDVFSLENGPGHIGFELTQFFSSLQDLASNPSDIALRNQVLQNGDSLVKSINAAYNHVATLQREADNRVIGLVGDVNRLSAQIAQLNGEISTTEVADQENLTLRDQRDEAVRQLSELVPVSTVEQADGTIIVSLANGFALVNGATSRALEATATPSFAPVGGYPPALDSGQLSHIVFDFDPTGGASHVDLTHVIRAGGGEVGGLLAVRGTQSAGDTSAFDADGALVDIASRVEAITRDLLTRFNAEYRGPDEDGGTAGLQPSSFGLDGSQPGVFGLFTFAGAVDDGDGQATAADLTANGHPNYASRLQFGVTDPRAFAAARDLDPAAGATSFAPGDAANIQGLLAQRDVAPTPFTVGNFTMTTPIEGVYIDAVALAGGASARARSDAAAAKAQEDQTNELRQSISGVNLDEEFSKLIQFQRAFEASARLVRVGDELLGQILQLLG